MGVTADVSKALSLYRQAVKLDPKGKDGVVGFAADLQLRAAGK